MKNHTRAVKIVENSDGALTECTVMDQLVSEWYNDQAVNLDDILALNKKAIDHLQNLRVLLKTELVANKC